MSAIDFIHARSDFLSLWTRATTEVKNLGTVPSTDLLYFDTIDLQTQKFFDLIRHLLAVKGTGDFATLVLKPDPFDYFNFHFGKYPGFIHRAVYPPSTGKLTPLTIEAASLNKNMIGAATSTGSANRRNGIACNAGSRFTGSLHAITAIGVNVTVGLTLFTRTPNGPNSTHNARVTASNAAFEAE